MKKKSKAENQPKLVSFAVMSLMGIGVGLASWLNTTGTSTASSLKFIYVTVTIRRSLGEPELSLSSCNLNFS